MNYDEIQPNSELRSYARQQLKGVWGKMVFAYFIYFLIYLPSNILSVLDSIDKQFPDLMVPTFPLLSGILSIVILIVTGPFSLGFSGFLLKRVRGEEIAVRNIFDGFKRILPGFLVMFFIALITALWSLLLIIPGIVKMYGYSMAFNILYDNPEIKPLEALKQSQIMMKGYKGKLFLLQLSFTGWAFLCILTLGAGYFWLYPYVSLSIANFYENLKRNQESKASKTPVDLFRAS